MHKIRNLLRNGENDGKICFGAKATTSKPKRHKPPTGCDANPSKWVWQKSWITGQIRFTECGANLFDEMRRKSAQRMWRKYVCPDVAKILDDPI
jgi:hypothetical protein